MTLAIAVHYPFGRLREAIESLSKIRPLKRQEAIIFLTDSRWTFPDNHYEDNGMKLHDIDNSTVLAYSGRVNIAAQCADNIKNKIHAPDFKIVNISSVFQRTYNYHKSHNDKIGIETGRLSFLMGKYLDTGEAKIILLESPDFKPEFVTDICGIGDKSAYEEVKKIVIPKLNKLEAYKGSDGDYFVIASTIIDAMRVFVIEKEHFKTVGGRIQFWVLNSRGITEQNVSYTHDPKGKAEWNPATISKSELQTAKDRLNLGPDYLVK